MFDAISQKPESAQAAQTVEDYIKNKNNRGSVVNDLHDIGIDYLTPCTDAGFKYVLNDTTRSEHLISFFCNMLDEDQNSDCRMLNGNKILTNRHVTKASKIPESIDFRGEIKLEDNKVSLKAASEKKIDSGFVVSISPNDTASTTETEGNGAIFKIGIESQVEYEKNAQSRWVDYGTRIFLYRGEKGEGVGSNCKTYEIALCRWSIKDAPMKLMSVSGQNGCDCDKDVSENLVDKVCLCCVSFFLGQSVQILEKINQHFQKESESGESKKSAETKKSIKNIVRESMEAERQKLSQQVFSFLCPAKNENEIEDIDYNSPKLGKFGKTAVDWLGFFKYGHLMSKEDVDRLENEDLKEFYESMRITENNVMDNIDQIRAIWGSVPLYNQKALAEAEKEKEKLKVENEKLLDTISRYCGHKVKESFRKEGFAIPYSLESAPDSAKKQSSGKKLNSRQSKKTEDVNSNKQSTGLDVLKTPKKSKKTKGH